MIGIDRAGISEPSSCGAALRSSADTTISVSGCIELNSIDPVSKSVLEDTAENFPHSMVIEVDNGIEEGDQDDQVPGPRGKRNRRTDVIKENGP